MPEPEIRFEDGAAYERFMGKWSQLAGDVFLHWLAPPPGLRWLDVGCGNGAFTEMIAERCTPAAVAGIDPSPAQISFARGRPALRAARLEQGDAMALPDAAASFDIAVMALVLFFVPDPARGVAEMCRVVRPGGTVTAYTWDVFGGGFPLATMQAEMRAMGMTPLLPPSAAASRMDAMQALWAEAGLVELRTREIAVQRSFEDFDDYWTASTMSTSMAAALARMPAERVDELRARVKAAVPASADGRIIASARANAIEGRVPGRGGQQEGARA
jgi:SAM-dependent methyltransferase